MLNMYDLKMQLTRGSTLEARELAQVVDAVEGVQAREMRLVLPTFVDASTPERTILVSGRIVGVDVSSGGPVVNGIHIAAGRALGADDDGEPVCIVEQNFADYYDLEPGDREIRIRGGQTLIPLGVGASPEYFMVVTEEGGGMANYDCTPEVIDCVFSRNHALEGGGMDNRDSSPIITNCKFSGNSAVGNDGGAVNNRNSSPIITNCTFSANSAYDWGGAIRNVFDSNLTIINCTFSGNLAQGSGGAMFNYHNSNTIITNCTFAENSAPNGNAIAFDSRQSVAPSNLQATNCILADGGNEIWNNDGSTIMIAYSNVQAGYEGEGNIDTDPCFVEHGYWDTNGTPDDANDDFWLDGDYHLLRTSPCIDAASDANIYTDIEGNIRPFDFPGADNNGELPDFDMGAYEATAQEANLLLLPRVIKRTSSQPRIMAWVHLPQAITKDQIDSDTALILYPGGIKAMRQFVFDNRRRGAQRIYPVRSRRLTSNGTKRKVSNGASPAQRLTPDGASIFAFFDKAELMDAVDDNGRVQLQVLGHLRQPGRYFYGSETITIKPQRQYIIYSIFGLKPPSLNK